MEHKTIKSEGGVVHYWIDKNENSEAIVFTHGLTANHMMFEKQVEYFSKYYTVITWDVPLHGQSRPYKNFSYENTAIDLKRILDEEEIKQVVLVGMSMGGYPSQAFAIKYPNMVNGFVALDTTSFGLDYYSKSDIWWLKRVEPLAKCIPNKILREVMAKNISTTKYSYNLMMKMLEPLTNNEICEQMGIAYTGFIKENRNVKFEFPVLILLGEYDKSAKVKEYSEMWSPKEGYPLHVIKNAAHFSNGDNPEDVNKEIYNFIKSLEKNTNE